MSIQSAPKLTIIAGPNGSGKSTLTRNTQSSLNVPIIDPDAEARKISPFNPESVALAAGKQAIRLALLYLENNESFAVETLAGNTYIKMMQQAKQKGYEINLMFVGINSVDTNIYRVAERVRRGGHSVPEADIRRRYERSLANLPIALQLTDNAIIFDNSTNLGYQIQLIIENRHITQQVENLSPWLIRTIPSEQLQDFQNQSRAQCIYPIVCSLINLNRNQLQETSAGVLEFEGSKYKFILTQNVQQLSLFRQGENSQELARYNTLNNSLISTKGLTEEDLSNWRRIQAIIQSSSQKKSTPKQDFEL